jgi:hypothetical protein
MESKVIRRRFKKKPEVKEVYHWRLVAERLAAEERSRAEREMEVLEGLPQLGAEVVKATVMALSAPLTSTSPLPGILFPHDASWGRQFQNHAKVLPYMVPKRVEATWVVAAIIT